MRTIWLVIKHEILVTIRRPSFWVMSLLVPLLMAAVVAGPAYIEAREDAGAAGAAEAGSGESEEIPAIGVIDRAGLLLPLPAGLPEGYLVPYTDLDVALADLDDDTLAQVILLPADYLETGRIDVYDREFGLLASQGLDVGFDGAGYTLLRRVLNGNLLGDAVLAAAVDNPTPGVLIEFNALDPAPRNVEGELLADLVSRLVPYIFYFVLIITSGYLLQSVTTEKENRTVEVLLLSAEPRDLLVGKMVGLSGVAIFQFALWMGGGALMLDEARTRFDLGSITLPDGFLIWAALFMLGGYLLYGAIMLAGGTLAPSARDAGQLTLLMIVPFMPVLMFASAFYENPNGGLALTLSLVPFTAPAAMVTRIAVADVPLWQLLLSLGGLLLFAYVFVLLAARFFRPQNLLAYTAEFKWGRFLTGWR